MRREEREEGVGMEEKKTSSSRGKSLLWDAAMRNKPNVLNANVDARTDPTRMCCTTRSRLFCCGGVFATTKRIDTTREIIQRKRMHVYIHICIYVCMFVCTDECTYAWFVCMYLRKRFRVRFTGISITRKVFANHPLRM